MKNNLLAFLLSIGLDEQRARLYLLALSKGDASASELAKEMKIGRTAIYDNLKVLEQGGYIKTINEGKRKRYIALHPTELHKNLKQKQSQLKDLLPDFLALYADKTKQPFVQLFTGKHAAREVFEDILTVAPKEYCYISTPEVTLHTIDKNYMKKWVQRRVSKKIHARALRVTTNLSPKDEIFNEQTKYLREIRYLPPYLELTSTIYIYKNNIAIITSRQELSAAIIYSPDTAKTLKQIFNFLWNSAPHKPY